MTKGRPSHHAESAGGTDRQPQLGHGADPGAVHGPVRSSKHAVEGYSESLDHEIRGSGVRVVLVEPAYTRTAFEGNVYQADQQLDVYRSARTNAEGVLRDGMKTADTPELVASAVVKASTELNPRRRYTAGRAARQISLLRRFVPTAAFDKSLRKQMRLPA
jgi:short-subunit dehydrogenase